MMITKGNKFVLIDNEAYKEAQKKANQRHIDDFFYNMRYFDPDMYDQLCEEFAGPPERIEWEYTDEIETGEWLEKDGLSLRYVMYPDEGESPYFQIWR